MFFGPLKIGPVGGLRTRATLFSPVETIDDVGGVSRSFVPVATIWCSLEPVSGDERFERGRVEEAITYRISMRWRNDVVANMRLSVGARWFDIAASVDPDGKNRRLIVLGEEIKK